MFIRLPSLVAAIAATASTASATSNNSNNLRIVDNSESNGDRSLQASAGCIAAGGVFTDCCPAADPNDGICTMLWCVDLDDVSVRDSCDCGQIDTACGQVAMFAAAVPGLDTMCTAAKGCCSSGTVTNPDWNTCMTTKAEDGEYETPNFDKIIPGGIPDMSAPPVPVTIPAVEATPAGSACPESLDMVEEIDDRTTLYYAIVPASSWDADDGLLCARMEVEGEQWIGFGISTDGSMVGSEAIIATPDDGMVKKYNLVKEGFFRNAEPMDESKQTLMDTSVTQEDDMTTMSFTKKLVEDGEIPILEVGDNIFLYARGNDNTLALHQKGSKFTKNFMEQATSAGATEPAAVTTVKEEECEGEYKRCGEYSGQVYGTCCSEFTCTEGRTQYGAYRQTCLKPEAATTGATDAATTDAGVTTVAATTAGATTVAATTAGATTKATAAATPAMALPPASVGCFLGQKPFMECCPAADPEDGICTLLWCVEMEDITVRDTCECGQVVTSCGQVAMFSATVDGLTEMCSAATSCCTVGETSNDDFDTCMGAAKGDFTIPDFGGMIAGGLPDFDSMDGLATTTAATAAVAGSTTAATVATTVPSEPAGTSGAMGVVASTGVAVLLIATMGLA